MGPGVSFLLPIEYDLLATFLGAVTGAWAGSRRGYDLVGVGMLAFVTSVGGGLLRDAIFVMQIPVVMEDRRYLWAILAAILVGTLTHGYAERFQRLFAYTDALALGVYGIFGANRALIAGIAPEAAVVVGLCNAVGGGMIRDVLAREEPLVFKPGQLYVVAAIVGLVLFVILSDHHGVETRLSAWIAIAVIFVLRVLAIRLNWTTHAVREWRWGRRKDK
jgi:uncharacterized membrane protein YeiH